MNSTASSPNIVDVTESNFQTFVLEESMKRPVIMDLWAEWCGPCKALSPTLEALAEEGDGQWLLAKINVDDSPALAQHFQAQSIPLVMAVFQGRILDQFVGVKGKTEIMAWLSELFIEQGLELQGPKEDIVPESRDEALLFWRAKLQENADDGKAHLELGKLYFFAGDSEGAEKELQAIPFSDPLYGEAQAFLALKELAQELKDAGGEEAVQKAFQSNPENPKNIYFKALSMGVSGEYEMALALLIDLQKPQTPAIPTGLKTQAQSASSRLFQAAGRGNPSIESLRKQLTRLLF